MIRKAIAQKLACLLTIALIATMGFTFTPALMGEGDAYAAAPEYRGYRPYPAGCRKP